MLEKLPPVADGIMRNCLPENRRGSNTELRFGGQEPSTVQRYPASVRSQEATLGCGLGRWAAEQLLVNPDVILGHMPISKPLFEFAATARTTDLLNFPLRFHRAVDIFDDKTSLSVHDNFGDRTAMENDSLLRPMIC